MFLILFDENNFKRVGGGLNYNTRTSYTGEWVTVNLVVVL